MTLFNHKISPSHEFNLILTFIFSITTSSTERQSLLARSQEKHHHANQRKTFNVSQHKSPTTNTRYQYLGKYLRAGRKSSGRQERREDEI